MDYQAGLQQINKSITDEAFTPTGQNKFTSKAEYGTIEGKPALYLDNPISIGGYLLLFDNEATIKKLSKFEVTVDHTAYQGLGAKFRKRKMVVKKRGYATIEARGDTLMIRDIKIAPFPTKGTMVVRIDSFWGGKAAKSTAEIPAKVHYMRKEQEELTEDMDEDRLQMIAGAVVSLGITIAMVFVLLWSFMASGKRDKKLEKQLKGVLKDGKPWKVYVMKDESPNAFCIIKPVMFIHSGLIKMLTEKELMSVMLHEAGHLTNKDIIKHIGAETALTGILIAALSTAAAPAWVPIVASIIVILRRVGALDIIFKRTLGRRGERKADSFAVKYGYGDEMITALEKIHAWIDKVRAKRPCGKMCKAIIKFSETTDEHPPLKKRVEDIMKSKETWEKTKRFNFVKMRGFITNKLKG